MTAKTKAIGKNGNSILATTQTRNMCFCENLCKDEPNLSLDDGRHTMFVNTKGSVGGSIRNMDTFFKYLNEGVSSLCDAKGKANVTDCMVKGFNSLGLSYEDIAKGSSIPVEKTRSILQG